MFVIGEPPPEPDAGGPDTLPPAFAVVEGAPDVLHGGTVHVVPGESLEAFEHAASSKKPTQL
jgi:hypothetical protein